MTRITKGLLFAVLVSALFGEKTHAATYTAASCAESDVSTAIGMASTGDTVIIPSCSSTTPGGSNTWSSILAINTAITLQGQGVGKTVLIDNVPKGTCATGPIIVMQPSGTAAWRVTGMTIEAETTDVGFCTSHFSIGGGSHAFRIDNITFNDDGFSPAGGSADAIIPSGDLWGVIDHVTCNNARRRCVLDHAQAGSNPPTSLEDTYWSVPDTMGTQQAVFMENDTCNQSSPNTGSNCFACEFGARCVIRFSTMSTIGSHGPESADRSVRQMEIYNNTFNMTGTSGGTAIDVRGGTGMVFDNTATTAAYGNAMTELSYYRCNASGQGCGSYFPWGQCNGVIYNGNNALWDSGSYPCLDQPGRGQGVLINRAGCSGGSSSCTAAGWPNEAQDPIYEWGNNNNGTTNPGITAFPAGTSPTQVLANADYYASTASFTGASGVGVGTLASRPSTCTAGVAYWATDQGNWNQSGSGGQGQLYQCSATNAWTTYYTPYTYPHPLDTSGGLSATAVVSGMTLIGATVY